MRQVLIPRDLPLAIRVPAADGYVHSLSGAAMGTTWSVKVAARGAFSPEPMRQAIEREIDRVVSQMSTWAANSDISGYNRAAPGTRCDLPAEFSHVLSYALAVARETAGCYDPTIGALVNLWGFGPQGPRPTMVPGDDEIAAAMECSGHRRAVFGPGCSVLQPGGIQLDLSSVAKGFAVDRVSEALARLGFANNLVEIGGELRGSGVKPDGSPWWIALEAASGLNQQCQAVVALHGISVATSGDAQRFFEHDGQRWSHTIDPRTGRPVSDRLASVTVIHSTCMCADALATALTVLGPHDGLDYAKSRGIAARFVVREAQGIDELVTPAFASMRN
jgi:thiamine biosynthesis lipoprotein